MCLRSPREQEEWERHWRRIAKPMPARRGFLPYEDFFTEEESEDILTTVLPEVMEDKWIVLQNDCTLDFHRSWTGFHVYSVETEYDPVRGGAYVVRTWVNREPEQYSCTNDMLDVARVRWLLRTMVLGQDLPYPVDPSLSGDDAILEGLATGGNAYFGILPGQAEEKWAQMAPLIERWKAEDEPKGGGGARPG